MCFIVTSFIPEVKKSFEIEIKISLTSFLIGCCLEFINISLKRDYIIWIMIVPLKIALAPSSQHDMFLQQRKHFPVQFESTHSVRSFTIGNKNIKKGLMSACLSSKLQCTFFFNCILIYISVSSDVQLWPIYVRQS